MNRFLKNKVALLTVIALTFALERLNSSDFRYAFLSLIGSFAAALIIWWADDLGEYLGPNPMSGWSGSRIGMLRPERIDQKTPPVAIRLLCWAYLLGRMGLLVVEVFQKILPKQ